MKISEALRRAGFDVKVDSRAGRSSDRPTVIRAEIVEGRSPFEILSAVARGDKDPCAIVLPRGRVLVTKESGSESVIVVGGSEAMLELADRVVSTIAATLGAEGILETPKAAPKKRPKAAEEPVVEEPVVEEEQA